MTGQGARVDALTRALAHAPFLAMLAGQRPQLTDRFVNDGTGAALSACSALDGDTGDVMAQLRRRRADLSLVLALADLAGEHDLTQTVHALSDFADEACDAALTAAFAERAPGEPVCGLAILALGKLGSHELNYSSDIDPILVFDPKTLPRRQRDDPGEAAVRIARRWVEILSQRTGDGHVLRVDLRLRPTPEVTPIILPIDAAISYYESQALAWEQAAFVRSRANAGDLGLGRHFLDAIQPFIWRRSMDFGQIKRIGDISKRIRSAYAGGQAFGPGFDLKRGRGGIREIEFFAQVQQLIHGGRDPSLRVSDTRDALTALATAGHIGCDTASTLADHYTVLRTIEHRLQMVADQQTHSLPKDAAAMDGVARLHGLADGTALIALLAPVIDQVGTVFDSMVGGDKQQARWPHDHDESVTNAWAIGFADGEATARRISEWRSGTMRILRSGPALDALEDVLPALMSAIGAAHQPDSVLGKFDRLVCGMPSAINFFHLLGARPQLLNTLVAVLGHAPTLADDLAQRPELIEGLIDATVFNAMPSPDALAAAMASGPVDDMERQLDHVRRVVGDHRFALGVQLVEGAADPLTVALGLADLADAALESLAAATVLAFERAHGRIAGGELLILALGRLGGRALTHASDLDLILLFTGDLMATSDGPRPLGTTTYFNRLGSRVIAALSVPTAAGRLYEVDTRLRPQGAQGPLVASLDAFARYQAEEAWTWEHMALTRARPVFGSRRAREQLQSIIDAVLAAPRDPVKLHADVVKMRSDIAAHKPAKGPLDVKLCGGGLVDAEFAIHAQQLRHNMAFDPRLSVALDQLVAAGHAPADACGAQALLARMLVTMRLMAPDGQYPQDAETRARIAHACVPGGDADWARLMRGHAAALACIGAWWHGIRDQVW
ncbi:MAG: bifunctional [glutamine synthetase] adenylyltransferase/[glutamine synthetase]-adenylyl-L-tyrosine phosphorylase [Pseudomonadota bacterium]